MTFATRRDLIPLLAAAAVALPAFLATPAQAQIQGGGGDYGSAEYEAYLEREAKDARQSSARQPGAGRQSAGSGVGMSDAPEFARATRKSKHFLYDARPEREQHFRGG
jgi:hypothetical protein